MIVVRISGGIGNQLFQYAMSRALSLRNGNDLKLDISFYDMEIEKDRPFKLSNFNISNLEVATNEDFKKIGVPSPEGADLSSMLTRKFYREAGSFLALEKRRMILEKTFSFLPEILDIKHDCYLVGVWQSEKYFMDYAEEIRKEFELKAPLSAEAETIKKEITSTNAISLHVRRGDQVHNPHLFAKHGVLGDGYYKQAVDYILGNSRSDQHLGSPRIFIFSDEIEWCKENLKFDIPATYVQGKGIADHEEMALMSLCEHNIIAKSSFSWWGAWLNKNPGKIVVAPAERFGSRDKSAPDLIPDFWVKI